MSQLLSIKQRLTLLKKHDAGFSVFGANKHPYVLQKTLREQDIRQFEQQHRIVLPAGYVQFLTELGNGGAGPYYGLEPLENSSFNDLDYKRPEILLNPSIPFPHTEPWNMEHGISTDC